MKYPLFCILRMAPEILLPLIHSQHKFNGYFRKRKYTTSEVAQ
jgi:hypothetical protein